MATPKNHILCSRSELNYYKKTVVQHDIQNTYESHILPRNTLLPANPISFHVEGGPDPLDLSKTRLSVSVKIVADDGTGTKAADLCAFINNAMSSLFASAQVSLRNVVVSHSDYNYPFRAYLETVLNYSSAVKTFRLASQGFFHDEPAKFDNPENPGFKLRKMQTADGNIYEFVGPLHVDICSQSLLLPSMLDFNVTLTPSRQEFVLQNFTSANKSFKPVIVDAKLLITKVKLHSPAAVSFEKAIAAVPVRIPIEYVKVNTISVPKGVTAHARDNIFSGNLPEKIIIGLVSNTTYSGVIETSPFNFAHHNLNFIQLKVNGRLLPSVALRPNFAGGNFTHAFNTLLDGSGCQGNFDIGVSLELYAAGMALYVFDTSADGLGSCEHETLGQQGAIGIELGFASATAQTLSMVVYSQTKATITIDRYRNVTSTAV